MGKKKSQKRFGHKVSAPGALGAQILEEKFAKPSQRVKARSLKTEAKTQYLDLSGVLSQVHKLEDDCAEQRDDGLSAEVLHEQQKEEADVPHNVEALIKNFEKEALEGVNVLEEEKIFASLMSENKKSKETFMEHIRETLNERHTEIQSQVDEASQCGGPKISEELQNMCKQAGEVLANYRSGPIPKMLKAMPKMRNWLHLLYYTNPEKWSAAAVYQLTRLYCSQKPEMVQAFYNKVLLPRCRDDIAFYKRLNYHLYQALSKALFKPAAFFKGIILPLCMGGDCTLREAVVFGSVVARKSIPILASSAAIMKIAQMEYSGANSIFLRILFNKKYALMWKVLDAVCDHYAKFRCEDRKLPVLWHQSLLTFVQRYKNDLSQEQKDALYGLAAFHSHHAITPEVRRELENSQHRVVAAKTTVQ
ncbi:bystin [Hyalella azteca]|uniref:Bystin n=1 Tax=Hyalella azteca TaxID=294128 RepID=A0A8B7N2C9_HYAAZ|nr:bystin [Hyalella azteca]